MKQVRPAEFAPITQNVWHVCCSSWIAQHFPQILICPGWRLHPLKGELSEYWSLSVSGNWRVIFRFVGSDIELVDYLDYH